MVVVMSCSANTASMVYIWCLTLLTIGVYFCRRSSGEALCIAGEREALLKFKHHLNDPSNRLISWVPHSDCCKWAGVVCSNDTGHILELHLRSSPSPLVQWYIDAQSEAESEAYERSRFGGDINPSLLDLNHLNYLDLSGNDFNGMRIPIFIGSLSSLTYLNLSRAGFSGKIPYQIGNLFNLLYLDLNSNLFDEEGFTGEVPCQIGNLTNLIYLDLGSSYYFSNELSVENLQWLLSLSSLQYLSMTFVNLSKAPDWLVIVQKLPYLKELHLLGCSLQYHNQLSHVNFSSLVVLDLSYNQGSSSMPKWIFDIHNLASLLLKYNDFEGQISENIRNLTFLENLDLFGNSFSSSIPNWLYSLPNLKLLNLGCNNLYGTISSIIENSTSLIKLDMSRNQLKGSLPASLGNLTSLVMLDMSYNQLEGNLPTSLGNLTSLVKLDMSSNQLEGDLLVPLGNLTSLVILDLSYNRLKGRVPTSLGNLCSLRELSFSIVKCNQQISEIFDMLSGCVAQTLDILSITGSKLPGHLTDQIGSFKNLSSLTLFNNNIGGPLPMSLGKLSSLIYLNLSGNQFTGNPFEIIGQLSRLQTLDVEDNQFQGVVNEAHLAGLTSLQSLWASNNQFTLEVSPKWSPCFQLRELYMDSWNLGPSFPTWIQSQKNLLDLSLSSTGISDSIPARFWSSFPSAYHINLSHNHIYGELSYTPMNPIVGMVVDLSSNNLSGQLPYISPDVYRLDLSRNCFSGFISRLLCRRQDGQMDLDFLSLAYNNLSGNIPDCWMMWQNLATVNLENNFFTGQIPKSMGALPQLRYLQLRNNRLSGKFPVFLKNSSELIGLDVGENEISGSIPSWVGERLLNLKILRLRSNNFSGEIPQQICTLKFLQVLDLAQNNLSGHIPKCMDEMNAMMIKNNNSFSYISCYDWQPGVCVVSTFLWLKGRGDEYRNALGLMTSVDLSNNRLSGEIPRQITSLSQLLSLNLSANHFRGQIPETIGNMGSLESLDFSRNQLSGEIPQSITNLSFLEKLDLSWNNLKGKIPTGTQLQSFDESSFIGNDLCGPPLPINCNSPEKVPDAEDKDKNGKGHEINWFFVSMAFGFVLGFWSFVGPLLFIRSWRYAYCEWLDSIWYKIRYCW